MDTIYRWRCSKCGHISEGTDKLITAADEKQHRAVCDGEPMSWISILAPRTLFDRKTRRGDYV